MQQGDKTMSGMDETNNTPSICYPSRPCNRWRTCARCARRRQAKIADAVQDLHHRVGDLRWHILYPHGMNQEAARAVKANWLRAAAPEGAIWTVEQSTKNRALHVNIITPAEVLYTPRHANYWQQVIAGDVRAVGAYIAKQKQMPRPADYGGRLYGKAGQVWGILANQTDFPAVAAAAAQYAINSHAMLDRAVEYLKHETKMSRFEHDRLRAEREAGPEQTKEELREIAARWLPDLLEWKEKNRQKTTLEIERERYTHETS